MTIERNPHREICRLCHEVSRVGFHVPDAVWRAALHESQWNDIVCLACFTRLADERGVEWDKSIEFYPVSRAGFDRWLAEERAAASDRLTEEHAQKIRAANLGSLDAPVHGARGSARSNR